MKKIVISACLLSLFSLSACGRKIEPGTTPGEAPVIKGLSFQPVTESPLTGTETFVGTVESPDRGVIAARIDGQVTRIAVKEGDRVKAGQLLLVLGDNLAADRLREQLDAERRGRREMQAMQVLCRRAVERRHLAAHQLPLRLGRAREVGRHDRDADRRSDRAHQVGPPVLGVRADDHRHGGPGCRLGAGGERGASSCTCFRLLPVLPTSTPHPAGVCHSATPGATFSTTDLP